MSGRNPLKFIYGTRPYHANPFTVLGVGPEATQAMIDEFARARELEIEAGVLADPGLNLRQGDCITAAQQLQDPISRLAFDLMLHWPEDERPL